MCYIKNTLKARVIKILSGISESGVDQLWVQVQNKSACSILVCIVYRPEIGLDCLETDLMPHYTKAMSLNKDIVLTNDLNCDLLTDNPKGNTLRSFCSIVNATQQIDKPTRVTKSSRTLVDVVIVSKPDKVKASGVIDLTTSDHYLFHVVLNQKTPRQAPNYIITRS